MLSTVRGNAAPARPKSMADYCVCLYVPVTVSTDGAGNIYTKRGGGGGSHRRASELLSGMMDQGACTAGSSAADSSLVVQYIYHDEVST